METREEIICSPTALAAFETLDKEIPGERSAFIQAEILPRLEVLRDSVSSLQAQIREWRGQTKTRLDDGNEQVADAASIRLRPASVR